MARDPGNTIDAGDSSGELRSGGKGDVRGELLAAAVKLFSERGYEGASVNDVVELADYTKGAFYHYFKSKEALLYEIHDEFISYGLSQGQAIIDREDRPEEALVLLIRELLRQVEFYQPQMTIALRDSRHLSYSKFPEAKRKRDAYEHIVVATLEKGMETGVFRNDLRSTRVLAFGIMGMCVWAHQWFSPSSNLSAEEIGDLYATLILDGLLTPTGESSS